MCGVTSETTSPSVLSTSRSTPCVLGCCGPMLTSISSVRTSNSIMRWSCSRTLAISRLTFPFLHITGELLPSEMPLVRWPAGEPSQPAAADRQMTELCLILEHGHDQVFVNDFDLG